MAPSQVAWGWRFWTPLRTPTFAAAAPRPPQQCVDLIRPRVALQAIPVWSELYLRHNEIASY